MPECTSLHIDQDGSSNLLDNQRHLNPRVDFGIDLPDALTRFLSNSQFDILGTLGRNSSFDLFFDL